MEKLEHRSILIQCPSCSSTKIWKDGLRFNQITTQQRYLCRDCGYRFVEKKTLSLRTPNIRGQVCDNDKGSKNLIVVTKDQTTGDNDKNYKILENYLSYLRKKGLKDSTIKGYMNCICSLVNNYVDLYNPESIKEYLVSLDVSFGRKRNIVHAYKHLHYYFHGDRWRDAPRYERVKKPQYLPTEKNLIQIISGVPNKHRPFCQLLYETGARSIEVWNLEWSAIDFEKNHVDITPVKNGEFRTLPISDTLKQMLNTIPRETEHIFKKGQLDNFRGGFRIHRRRLANDLGEPEIEKCSYKTFRTYYATKASYQYEMNEVQYRLGHTHISTTQKYVRRSHAMNREYVSHVTRTIEEEQQAIEQGFEYVKDRDGVSLWKRPK